MKKYHLLSKIRRRNPYKSIMKKNQEHTIAGNILNREFHAIRPYRKIGTDITYVKYKKQWIYLSIMKDMATAEILSFGISENVSMQIIHTTFLGLEKQYEDSSFI
jgi:transposase InsO family protein